jgi:K+-sensing histidine kinase KdpD
VTNDNRALAAAGGALLTLAVGAALVVGRDTLAPEITVLLLALTVVISGRFGGRAGGIASAVMAATTFDFFHTKPYLSLKISDGDYIAVMIVILAVGLVAGDLSARAARDRSTAAAREGGAEAVARLLKVARERSTGDLEFAVTVELTDLLSLRHCYFTADDVDQPALGQNGSLPTSDVVFRDDGFELPADGVAIPVEAKGTRFGSFVCLPNAHVGIDLKRREMAVAAVHVFALAKAGAARRG